VQVNDSLVYCNGKYVANFEGESNTGGENTFSIGSISSTPSPYNSQKHIAYFSLYHGLFSVKLNNHESQTTVKVKQLWNYKTAVLCII